MGSRELARRIERLEKVLNVPAVCPGCEMAPPDPDAEPLDFSGGLPFSEKWAWRYVELMKRADLKPCEVCGRANWTTMPDKLDDDELWEVIMLLGSLSGEPNPIADVVGFFDKDPPGFDQSGAN